MCSHFKMYCLFSSFYFIFALMNNHHYIINILHATTTKNVCIFFSSSFFKLSAQTKMCSKALWNLLAQEFILVWDTSLFPLLLLTLIHFSFHFLPFFSSHIIQFKLIYIYFRFPFVHCLKRFSRNVLENTFFLVVKTRIWENLKNEMFVFDYDNKKKKRDGDKTKQ